MRKELVLVVTQDYIKLDRIKAVLENKYVVHVCNGTGDVAEMLEKLKYRVVLVDDVEYGRMLVTHLGDKGIEVFNISELPVSNLKERKKLIAAVDTLT